jgi:diguanylate cyclase (GGDEF)-like protein
MEVTRSRDDHKLERQQERNIRIVLIRLSVGALLSFGAIMVVIGLLEWGRSERILGLPWGERPNGENIILRAVILNALQLALVFFRVLFRGHALIALPLRKRLYWSYCYMLALSYQALILQYLAGDLAEVLEVIIGVLGLTGIPITIYALALMVRIYFAIDERLQQQEELSKKYYHQLVTDPLTGLPNRVSFQEDLTRELQMARTNGKMVAVLFLDLDRFKYINDTLGHKVGDQLLLAVASRMKSCLTPLEKLYRLGGDEFIILKACHCERSESVDLAKRILGQIEQPFEVEGHDLFISTSIGISFYPEDGDDMDTLYKNADMAMYRAKDSGRNTYQTFDSMMNERAVERLSLEKDLRKAIEREEFVVYYQPQIEVRTGRLIGMEALVRWMSPERGMVSPGQFIPLAEDTKLIVPIGEWVLRTACRQTKAWQEAGYDPLRVSVNLSAEQFQQPKLIEMIAGVLEETGLDPRSLELEVTESMTMHNIDRAIATMHELEALGIRISIDDFGTGHSSLNYLKKLPIHTLKIDQSFVRDIPDNPDDAAIATAIIAMAHSLNLNVVAEGVETEEQLQFLRERCCDEMQGYLISRPLPPEEFAKFLERERERVVKTRS